MGKKFQYRNITAENAGHYITVWLNRPEVHNALDQFLIDDLISFFQSVNNEPDIRWIIIRGTGKSFCAGADIKWMFSEDISVFEEKFRLDELLNLIYDYPVPVISVVHGNVFGGATGILAASDITLAHIDTVFSLSETRLGLIPAVVSWFVAKRTGISSTLELTLSGRKFSSQEALTYGLIHKIYNCDLENSLQEYIHELGKNGPQAMKNIKMLLKEFSGEGNRFDYIQKSKRLLASIRQTAEAKEGMNAFLQKRQPEWVNQIQHEKD